MSEDDIEEYGETAPPPAVEEPTPPTPSTIQEVTQKW